MPAKNEKQRKLMAMALHNPSKVYKKNRGVLKMSKRQLKDFVKGPVRGSGKFTDGESNQGYKVLSQIPHPTDPDIKCPGSTVQVAGDIKEKSTGSPIDRPALEVPGFETSKTINQGVAV